MALEPINLELKQQIGEAWRRVRPQAKNDSEAAWVIAATLNVGKSSVNKYKDFKPPILETVEMRLGYHDFSPDILELEEPVQLQEMGRGAKRVESVNFMPETSGDFEIESPIKPVSFASGIEIDPDRRMVELVGSDFHFPYENKAAVALFFKVAENVQPDIIILLGDVMDCYAVSSHDKDADRATPGTFKAELDYTKERLKELRALCPDARIIYKEGNHETRLSRYINKNAAVLSKLKCITLPSLLDLDAIKIEWLSENQRLRVGKLHKIHGHEVGGSGMSPARTKYSRMLCNFIFGHLHTEDKHRARSYDGSQHGAWCNPCLCDLEPEYLHHAHNWSNGFAKIEFEAGGNFQLDQINIIQESSRDGRAKCYVGGQKYEVDLEVKYKAATV